MNTIFDIGPILPGNFKYHTGFISETEEMQLIQSIEQLDLQQMKFMNMKRKEK